MKTKVIIVWILCTRSLIAATVVLHQDSASYGNGVYIESGYIEIDGKKVAFDANLTVSGLDITSPGVDEVSVRHISDSVRLGFKDAGTNQSGITLVWRMTFGDPVSGIVLNRAGRTHVSDFVEYMFVLDNPDATIVIDQPATGRQLYDVVTGSLLSSTARSGVSFWFDDNGKKDESTGAAAGDFVVAPQGGIKSLEVHMHSSDLSGKNIGLEGIDIDFRGAYSIPEPSSFVLLIVALGIFCVRKR